MYALGTQAQNLSYWISYQTTTRQRITTMKFLFRDRRIRSFHARPSRYAITRSLGGNQPFRPQLPVLLPLPKPQKPVRAVQANAISRGFFPSGQAKRLALQDQPRANAFEFEFWKTFQQCIDRGEQGVALCRGGCFERIEGDAGR